ncbi:hypothetical protein [Pedobacter namyangjuensis]|uniref:hypothetical protein n=1 Tax=Pedobacter namyangjuensis TaxID=600626 RepID=UPI000DE2F118|nr:hypothetical protein [Pedobacter namyangjuensis]
MEKHPFDETGLQQLLAELYALPPAELQTQSQNLLADPKTWIQTHFDLDVKQQAFLDQMPVATLAFLGDQGSFAIAHQLPVTLQKNGDPPKEDEGKLFTPKSRFSFATDNLGQTLASGEMTILVSYGQTLGPNGS